MASNEKIGNSRNNPNGTEKAVKLISECSTPPKGCPEVCVVYILERERNEHVI